MTEGNKKYGLIFGWVLFLLMFFFSMPVFAAEKPILLRYANFPPASTFPCVQMERWKTEVEKRSHGRLKIETFSGGTILDAKSMMDGIIGHQADIGVVCMAYQPGRFVVTNGVALPLGIPDATVGSQVLWRLVQTYSPDEFKEVKVLAAFTTAPINLMTKMPIRNLSDLSKQSIRASGSAAQILKGWGANTVGMPMPDTAEAIQKGLVKGLFSSLEILKDMKFAESCKYVTFTDTVVYPFAVIMNKDAWNALPKDLQQILIDLGPEQSEWTGAYMDQHVKESLQWATSTQGVTLIQLSNTEKKKFTQRLQPITDKWVVQMTHKKLNAPKVYADLTSWVKYYSQSKPKEE